MSLVAVQLDTLLSLGSTGLRTANVADLDFWGSGIGSMRD